MMKASNVIIGLGILGVLSGSGCHSLSADPEGSETATSDIGTDTTPSTQETEDTGETNTGATDTRETDTGETEPEQPDTHPNPCPGDQHAGCYGQAEVWCLDAQDAPKKQLETCDQPKQCIERSSVYAECGCDYRLTRTCHVNDIWLQDACGGWHKRLKDCEEGSPCTERKAGEFSCCTGVIGQTCDKEGNLRELFECDGQRLEGAVLDPCTKSAHRVCTATSAKAAACTCTNRWTGPKCGICPLNFDDKKDCNECTGYWTGANCDTCEGFGDNCQCPSGEFVAVPNTRICLTCPMPTKATNGICTAKSAMHLGYTAEEAEAACPEGFGVPYVEDFMALYNDCKVDISGRVVCGDCSDNPVCKKLFERSFDTVLDPWTAGACKIEGSGKEGRRFFAIEGGGECKCGATSAHLICSSNRAEKE